MAEDSSIKGVLKLFDPDLKKILLTQQIKPKPLLVCSGGTSSRCAANGHFTLDLRDSCSNIDFDSDCKTVNIGCGITMGKLAKQLSKNNRSFPIGLSGQTGTGYILTGGISPVSRWEGLAIDQVLEIKGIWGNGENFVKTKPDISSSNEEKLIWRALCGAAPHLAIITNLKLATQSLKPLKVIQVKVDPNHLAEIIQEAEQWPNSASLSWMWGDEVTIFVVIQIDSHTENIISKIRKIIANDKGLEVTNCKGLFEMPEFKVRSRSNNKLQRCHSEVVGLLGPKWGNSSPAVVNLLKKLISERPHPNCSIASQQLGGATKDISYETTSFIHRKSIWKPWITASWPVGDKQTRESSLTWLERTWNEIEPICPGVHLAQMHQHLKWHKREINSAFQEWLPGLQQLKSRFDPNGLLPPF